MTQQSVVAFVFTDIEGSTRLLAALGDETYGEVLATHWRILRDAWLSYGGREVRSEGDGGFAVFPDAAAALAACVDAQLAFGRHPWPRELRVRMGVHAGTASRTSDGDYFGLAVHHAARVAQAANGGQIVLSEDAARSIDALPEFVALTELGTYTLRDVEESVRLHIVEHPDLPRDGRPLRAPSAAIHNLPLIRTAFIGRVDEGKELSKLVASRPLVTVLGTGGVGKTRLALSVATAVTGLFEDGVWLVELATVRDEAATASHVASSLGLPDDPARHALDVVVDHLKTRSVLLLLDNCEHLIDEAAKLADAVLRACAAVTILATSREPLRVRGETAWRLGSLSVPGDTDAGPDALLGFDAVGLFVERAREAAPAFVLDGGTAPVVAQICRRLDGIPLALELAAATLATLELRDAAARLDNRFAALVGGYRSDLPRQQTLRATIDWSFDLLTDDERALFARLSVFVGGATLEAVDAVCAAGDPVAALITSLVDKSLVVATGDRYRMLETIRGYASERLAERGETDRMREGLRDALIAMAKIHGDEPRSATTERIAAEIDNTRAALGFRSDAKMLELINAVAVVWARRVSFHECRHWLEAALDANPDPSRARANALDVFAEVTSSAGLFDVARRSLDEAIDWHRKAGDDRSTAGGLHGRAEIALTQGDIATAKPDLEESLRIATHVDAADIIAKCSHALAHVAMYEGRLSDAVSHANAARDSFAALDLKPYEAQALMLLGEIQRGRNNGSSARAALEEAVELLSEIGDRSAGWFALWILGQVETADGDVGKGIEHLREAHEISDALGDVYRCLALGSLSYAIFLAGDRGAALDLIETAIEQAVNDGPAFAVPQNRLTRGAMRLRCGENAPALDDATYALAEFVSSDAALDAMRAVTVCGLASSGLGAHDVAVALLTAVLAARDEERASIDEVDAPLIDHALERARSSLSERDFDIAKERGNDLDISGAATLVQSVAASARPA